MLEIISHTPVWVFAIFFLLLFLGIKQSKETNITVRSLFILPVAMLLFSFYGIYSVYGFSALSVLSWCGALVITTFIGRKYLVSKTITYLSSDKRFNIPGSWVPLVVMMAIFFSKYFVNVALVLELPVINNMYFMVLSSCLFGVMSGFFIARSLVIYKQRT